MAVSIPLFHTQEKKMASRELEMTNTLNDAVSSSILNQLVWQYCEIDASLWKRQKFQYTDVQLAELTRISYAVRQNVQRMVKELLLKPGEQNA
jgi:hypothetical protein